MPRPDHPPNHPPTASREATWSSVHWPRRAGERSRPSRVERGDATAPRTLGKPHSLTREEVFVVLEGEASVRLDGEQATAHPGDAIGLCPRASRSRLRTSDDSVLPAAVLHARREGQAWLADGSRSIGPRRGRQ